MNKPIQLLFPTTVKVKCPVCAAGLRLDELRYGFRESFRCPNCHSEICVSPLWLPVISYSTGLLAYTMVGWLSAPYWRSLGQASFFIFLLSGLALWIVLSPFVGYVIGVLFPPKLVRYRSSDLSLKPE